MLRRVSLFAAAILIPAAVGSAQFKAGDWELTLGGTGSNGPDFNGTTFAVTGNLGYFFTDNIEVSLRQSVGYTDLGNTGGSGSAWTGATRVALDYHFDLGKWQPYVGANIGYVYGDGINDTWEGGPEAGIKYFVNPTTFIQLSVEYQFFFDTNSRFDNAFSDGQFIYGLNIGFKFRP